MFDATQPWVTVATFGSVLEADFAAATLQEAGIAARTTGTFLGLFGAGYQGPSLHGVQVQVPYHRVEEAADLLASLESVDADPDEADDLPEETP